MEGKFMEPRIDYLKSGRGVLEAMRGLERYLDQSGLDRKLMTLLKLRASQMNGCAYCIDMHWKDLRAAGENEQRLYGLNAWRESPYYTERERAALAWTEAVTNIQDGHAPDEVFEETRRHFSEKEFADLTLAIASINAWNRLAISAANRSRKVPTGHALGSSGCIAQHFHDSVCGIRASIKQRVEDNAFQRCSSRIGGYAKNLWNVQMSECQTSPLRGREGFLPDDK